jgi:mono/diheme cytochrome c family protein
LSQSEWVEGNKQTLIKIVLEGMNGSIQVGGKQYNGTMPGHHFLSDDQVSEVLTYIRTNFGNNASAITKEEVKQVREVR